MDKIRWLPLRLNNLPLVHKQTLAVLDKFLLTRADLLQGDILALETLKYINLAIMDRLKEIDAFYLTRPLDPRMRHVFSIRVILKQIGEGCRQFEGDYEKYNIMNEQKAMKIHDSPERNREDYRNREEDLLFGSSITPIQMELFTPRPVPTMSSRSQRTEVKENTKTPQNKNLNKINEQLYEPIRLSDLKKPKTLYKSKTPVKTAEPSKRGTGKKVEFVPQKGSSSRNQQLQKMERERKEAASRLQSQQVKKSFRELSQLVFTIKMTKEEYKDFMRLKRKNNHA